MNRCAPFGWMVFCYVVLFLTALKVFEWMWPL